MRMIALRNEHLSITVNPHGAELGSIVSHDGRAWLWNGDARYWAGRAPILFPVVGASAGGQVKIAGHTFQMEQHGFARRSDFSLISSTEQTCLLRLSQNEATLARFPFRFELDIAFALEGATLAVIGSVKNRTETEMPFGFGFHPAFAWPLPDCEGLPHLCWLDAEEEPRTRRLTPEGLLIPDAEPSIFKKGMLTLEHRLFERRAIILDDLRSRTVSYGVPRRTFIDLEFEGLTQLGIWTKPDAPFLCLEPWQGMAAEQGATIDLEHRPGTVTLSPGGTRSFVMRATFSL